MRLGEYAPWKILTFRDNTLPKFGQRYFNLDWRAVLQVGCSLSTASLASGHVSPVTLNYSVIPLPDSQQMWQWPRLLQFGDTADCLRARLRMNTSWHFMIHSTLSFCLSGNGFYSWVTQIRKQKTKKLFKEKLVESKIISLSSCQWDIWQNSSRLSLY